MTDPIADFLARLRNAIVARKAKVEIPASKVKMRIAEILRDEGFVGTVEAKQDDKQGTIVIHLRYGQDHANAISGIRRVSRPGQRKYVPKDKLPRVRSGLGTSLLTTSHGIMTDRAARKAGVGGEILCEVW
jgi:small subunit ribosomal protein S8